MNAIIKTGGKQYIVKPGQILKVEKLEGKKGDSLVFNEILALSEKSNNVIGNPLVKGASVEAKILEQIRNKKILVFKKRRRKDSRSTSGHRQSLTVLRIESINQGTKKITVDKLAEKSEVSKKEIKSIISKEKSKTKVKKKSITKKAVTSKKNIKKKILRKKM